MYKGANEDPRHCSRMDDSVSTTPNSYRMTRAYESFMMDNTSTLLSDGYERQFLLNTLK